MAFTLPDGAASRVRVVKVVAPSFDAFRESRSPGQAPLDYARRDVAPGM
jgi:hypothetical protein